MHLQLYRSQIAIKSLSLFLLPAVQQYTGFTASSTVVATADSTIGFYMGALFFG